MSQLDPQPHPVTLHFMDGNAVRLIALETATSRDGRWFLVVEHRPGGSPMPRHFPLENLRCVTEADALALTTATLRLTQPVKAVREALCIAQASVSDEHVARTLGMLVAECDRHRPLGPDGKHDDRHTATCGCDLSTEG